MRITSDTFTLEDKIGGLVNRNSACFCNLHTIINRDINRNSSAHFHLCRCEVERSKRCSQSQKGEEKKKILQPHPLSHVTTLGPYEITTLLKSFLSSASYNFCQMQHSPHSKSTNREGGVLSYLRTCSNVQRHVVFITRTFRRHPNRRMKRFIICLFLLKWIANLTIFTIK